MCEPKIIRMSFLLSYVQVCFILEVLFPITFAIIYHISDEMLWELFIYHHPRRRINLCFSTPLYLTIYLKYCTPWYKRRTGDANY